MAPAGGKDPFCSRGGIWEGCPVPSLDRRTQGAHGTALGLQIQPQAPQAKEQPAPVTWCHLLSTPGDMATNARAGFGQPQPAPLHFAYSPSVESGVVEAVEGDSSAGREEKEPFLDTQPSTVFILYPAFVIFMSKAVNASNASSSSCFPHNSSPGG